MSILCDKNTRLMVQGVGKAGMLHLEGCKAYGTNIVAGVHPGKGGTKVAASGDSLGVPVFETVEQFAAVVATSEFSVKVTDPPALTLTRALTIAPLPEAGQLRCLHLCRGLHRRLQRHQNRPTGY